eukprot:jgi/Picsp_1/2916/NSC_01141-R1_peptidase u32
MLSKVECNSIDVHSLRNDLRSKIRISDRVILAEANRKVVSSSTKSTQSRKTKHLRKFSTIYESPDEPKAESEREPSMLMTNSYDSDLVKPEVLAPAGGWTHLFSAVQNGADAVYFGVTDFNARVRADNFTSEELPDVMKFLHEHGMKGYLTLNVLVFDNELKMIAERAQTAEKAGVDALIVQDIGAVRIIREVSSIPIHGSTQMTVTSAEGLLCAADMGIERVVVARELSIEDIAEISEKTRHKNVEVEAFVHGAMCVSYSGQCFSSEFTSGRSANRGQCAQACRLPYGLLVDGQLKDLVGKDYLLSPQDLAAVDLIPELIKARVVSLKIEGRLKSPEYVAVTTAAYRKAVDKAWDMLHVKNTGHHFEVDQKDLLELRQIFSRGQDEDSNGLTHGFLEGSRHQELVIGRNPRHRGIYMGKVVSGTKSGIRLCLQHPLRRGDGIVIDRGRASEEEIGGSVFEICVISGKKRKTVSEAQEGEVVEIKLGPDLVDYSKVSEDDFVWRTKDPVLSAKLRSTYSSVSSLSKRRVPLDVTLSIQVGKPLKIEISESDQAYNLKATAYSDVNVEISKNKPITGEDLKNAVGIHLGDIGPFVLQNFEVVGEYDACFIPMNQVKAARRKAMEILLQKINSSSAIEHLDPESIVNGLLHDIQKKTLSKDWPKGSMQDSADWQRPRIRLLCRNPEQVDAAITVDWLEEIIIDFLEVKGLRESCDKVHQAGKRVIVAAPRILKPDEQHLWLFYLKLGADAILVRSTGILYHFASLGGQGTLVEAADNHVIPPLQGDSSLNAANIVSADLLLSSGLETLAPAHDCNSNQIINLLKGLGERKKQMEIILHTNLPVFHTEHCIFARFLSNGNSYLDCGRPCERHTVHIRDPDGIDHLVEADMGCRNTVFEGKAQSALQYLPEILFAGAECFRIELVDQSSELVPEILEGYRRAITSGSYKYYKDFSEWLQTVPDANGRSQGFSSGSLEPRQERDKSSMKPTAYSSSRRGLKAP